MKRVQKSKLPVAYYTTEFLTYYVFMIGNILIKVTYEFTEWS